MITDEKRREIANELRKQAVYNSGSLGEWWQRLQEIVTCEIDFANPQETYRAIADLIDRPTTTRHGKFKTKYGRETPCCEVCGYSIGDMRWNHCPKCGAVIVDD